MLRATFIIAGLSAVAMAVPASASSLLDYIGQCVPFARAASGIQLFGDAWTWWSQAEGRYRRGERPQPGAVLVFARTDRLPLGHVAVISRVVDSRVAMVTHANWSRMNGERGHAEQDVTLTDVSAANDWSAVKVWFRDNAGLGGSIFPTYGFIYGTRTTPGASARTASELTGRSPDYVGALIDSYAQ